jgi:hypothetical protein
MFSPLSNSVAIEDNHAHNTERNENLFEKETNKAEEVSDPSQLYTGKVGRGKCACVSLQKCANK